MNWNDDYIKVWLGKIYELFSFYFIYVCFVCLERFGKFMWLVCVRMKEIYVLLVLIFILFGFMGGWFLLLGRILCLFMLGFKFLY